MTTLTSSGPIASTADGQIIQGLDIIAKAGVNSGDGIRVLHNGVIVRGNRVRHGDGCRHGIAVGNKSGVVIEDNDVAHTTTTPGQLANANMRNINCDGTIKPTVQRNRVARGSSGVYFHMCTGGGLISFTEGYDFRGPMPRGQLIQVDKSPDTIVEDFYGLFNDLTSFMEDCLNIYNSPRCIVRRGLLVYNNSPSGIGVIVEGSNDCIIEDVDTLFMHNGNFSASASANTLFNRCRARDQRMTEPPGGRGYATSGHAGQPLIFHSINSSTGTRYRDCKHWNCGNNVLWSTSGVVENGIVKADFTPRAPIKLTMPWEEAEQPTTPPEGPTEPTPPPPDDLTARVNALEAAHAVMSGRMDAVEGRLTAVETGQAALEVWVAEIAKQANTGPGKPK